ncbi:MAG: peptidoglycan DD-metalloendopeptidase family protein [Bacillota bacterium]|nr:peptidoglycan DD-metalloendopeptidase family protein [Bacillota bacterium]
MKFKKAKIKKIINICFCTAIVSAIVVTANTTKPVIAYASSLSDLQQQKQELQDKGAQIDQQLQQAKSDLSNKQSLKTALEQKISNVQQQIDLLNQTIDRYNQKIDEKQSEIDSQQSQIQADYTTLRARIRAMYISGDVSSLEIILGSKNFNDFVDKAYLVQQISNSDKKMIDGMKAQIDKITSEKADIQSEKDTVSDSVSQEESKKDELNGLMQQCNSVIADLQSKTSKLQQDEDENSSQAQQLSDKMAEIQRQYTADHGGTSTTSPDVKSNGIYTWPMPGVTYISAWWGDGRSHKGIDIAGPYGAKIVAAASGTVIVCDSTDSWGDGWGYHVMIDHGGGYATQYAHFSYVAVTNGEHVDAGQYIGNEGETGDATGPHLHFECWFNGTRYDPAPSLGLSE